jgi:hypothetical protein
MRTDDVMGSKPHDCACPLRPESDRRRLKCDLSRCAISVPTHRNKKHRYFDHLVGGHLHDRLGGLEIDDQLEFGRLDYWKIGRLLTLENSADVDPAWRNGTMSWLSIRRNRRAGLARQRSRLEGAEGGLYAWYVLGLPPHGQRQR